MSDDLPPIPPPAPWDFVEVHWEDSGADDETWVAHEDVADNTLYIITRGWLIKETKRSITIAASYYRSDGKWFFGEKLSIPRKAFIGEVKKI